MVGLPCLAQEQPNIQEIRRKVQAGQPLTPEERQALQRVNAQQLEVRKQYGKEHPRQSSFGLTALTDLGADQYKGEEGGLYPGGNNEPPAAHRDAGVKLARQVAPIDGKIMLLAIGFSNPNMEFPAFTLDSGGGVFLVAGLAEGDWHVAHDGAAPVTVRVSAEEKALWFEGSPGRYPLTR